MTAMLATKTISILYHSHTSARDGNLSRSFPPRQFRAGNSSSFVKFSANERFIVSQAASAPYEKSKVFLLDVNSLCYQGTQPCLHSFANWLSLFFSEASLSNPVIAVLDGEDGNEYRRKLMPSYKAHRRKTTGNLRRPRKISYGCTSFSELQVTNALNHCNVPVIKAKGFEADDIIATLSEQAVRRGHQVVIGSPDKDFKQLISEDVDIVIPISKLKRWSFYTLRHYTEQYKCDPSCDLSLRSIMGDEADGVPGLQQVAPGIGLKTALKLLKRHGSLSNLLAAAAVRTVGKQYAQDALTKHADFLRRNFQVLGLRRNADVHFKEEWLLERDSSNDSSVLSKFIKMLENGKELEYGHLQDGDNG